MNPRHHTASIPLPAHGTVHLDRQSVAGGGAAGARGLGVVCRHGGTRGAGCGGGSVETQQAAALHHPTALHTYMY